MIEPAHPEAALTLAEAVPLGYVLVLRAAEDVGVRALGIKGPVLALQGLREPKQSVDIDVLVDPRAMPRLQAELERLGWHDGGGYATPGIVPMHSVNHGHPQWPLKVDLHHWFPGFLADSAEVFDVLWARRASATLANVDVPVTDPVASAAVCALHYLRDVHRQVPLEHLAVVIERTWSADRRADLAVLAADTGAADTLRPFLDRIGAASVAPTRAVVVPLADWQMRSQAHANEVLRWLVALKRTPWWRRPAFVVKALWLKDEHFDDLRGPVRRSPRDRLRARWTRVKRGWRALPYAWSEYRRLRG